MHATPTYHALLNLLEAGARIKPATLRNALAVCNKSPTDLLLALHGDAAAQPVFTPHALCGYCGRGVVRVRSSSVRRNGDTRQLLECPECGRREGRTILQRQYNAVGTDSAGQGIIPASQMEGDAHDRNI